MPPSVVGHRGWPARYPDNTLAGLMAAAVVADMIEVDVRRCGDGRLVLSHDPVIEGHTVATSPWRVLSELDVGGGHHPVLLDEALAALPGTPVQLEVKNLPFQDGFEPDHRLGLEAAARARPGDMVTSFNPVTIAEVRRRFPGVATGLVTQNVSLEDALASCIAGGHHALIAHEADVLGDVESCLTVYVWTVNDPRRARELVERGVTGIITDDPGLIRSALGSDEHEYPG